MIRVKFENVVTKNGKGYKILSFSLLDKRDLPDVYINGKENGTVAYTSAGSIFLWTIENRYSSNVFSVGNIISEDEMKRLVRELKAAGKHLSRVMKPIHELEKSGWVGKIWEVKI